MHRFLVLCCLLLSEVCTPRRSSLLPSACDRCSCYALSLRDNTYSKCVRQAFLLDMHMQATACLPTNSPAIQPLPRWNPGGSLKHPALLQGTVQILWTTPGKMDDSPSAKAIEEAYLAPLMMFLAVARAVWGLPTSRQALIMPLGAWLLWKKEPAAMAASSVSRGCPSSCSQQQH